MGRKINVILLVAGMCGAVSGQPVASEKQVIEGLEVYRDFRNPDLFYYGPGKLSLSTDVEGKPKFQFVQMRYTGTGVYGDRGEKRFFNVVEFSVSMRQTDAETLKAIRKRIGGRADLRPLPIKSITAFLVAPLQEANGNGYRKIGNEGSLVAGDDANGGNGSFWTERTFTTKVADHEAQLLWEQITQGQLALSLGYAFQANLVAGGTGNVLAKDGRAVIREVTGLQDKTMMDTTIATHTVCADAFPIRVDVSRWPDLIRKVDINEGIPPAYAALEVRCYDFTHDLRPDLAFKSVELEATGVGGGPVRLPPRKFMAQQPDRNTLQIRFPYAVRLTEPLRYRVTEFTREGSRTVHEWKVSDAWISTLDLSTSASEQKFERRTIEVEASSLQEHHLVKVELAFSYTFRGSKQEQFISFHAGDELPIRMITLTYDKGTPVSYRYVWEKESGEQLESADHQGVPEDDYIYLERAD